MVLLINVAADGTALAACPHLSSPGRCEIYEKRPQACREFFCDAFRYMSLDNNTLN